LAKKFLFEAVVRAIAKRRILGLLAIAEPNFAIFFSSKFQAFESSILDGFVLAIAQRLFVAEATSAPSIGFAFFNSECCWTCFGNFG
jgi:hypothetical protein